MNHRLTLGLVWVLLAMGCGSQAPQPTSTAALQSAESPANAQFLRLAQVHAAKILGSSPEWATQLGATERMAGAGYASRLSDYSESALQAQIEMNQALLAELQRTNRHSLTGTAAITYDVMHEAYQLAARQNRYAIGLPSVLGVASPYVIDQLFGPQISVPRLLTTQHAINSQQDVDSFLARLGSLDEVLDQIASKLKQNAAQSVVPPAFALEGIAHSARQFNTGAALSHPITRALKEKAAAVAGLSANDRSAAVSQTAEILRTQTFPAYQRLANTARELIPAAGTGAGIWRIPNGAAIYQLALDAYGADGRSPEAIHALGLADVARIHTEMAELLRSQGYADGSIAARLRQVAADPSTHLPNTDAARQQLLEHMEGYLKQAMTIAPSWFNTLPKQAISVERIPTYEQDASSGAYYVPPSLDGSRPGALMVNLKNTADWPLYMLRTLVHHEAVPGHHFQVSLKQAVTDMPMIRNMMFFSEFGEGWALYTEALAKEMGLYEDDALGDLGRLRAEVIRAARLVVDTGLHHKRWSRERAIDWMLNATGETRDVVTREVNRYAVWPGQATSYKLGMKKFQQLRDRAREHLGQRFDIRAFHEVVLREGSMPMSVLEARVNAWMMSR